MRRGTSAIVMLAVPLLIAAPGSAGSADVGDSGAVRCPRIHEAASLSRAGRVFTGDLTGDGHGERVSVVSSPLAPGECGIFLLVRRGRTTAAIRLPSFVRGPARASLRRGLPHIVGLFRVDRTQRLDVLVQVDRAPGGGEYALYRVRRGRLIRPRFLGAPRNRLRWARRSGLRGVFDCERPRGSGRLSQFEAEVEPGGWWDFRRETYRSRDATFAPIGGFGVVVEPGEAAARFAAWPARPLVSCG